MKNLARTFRKLRAQATPTPLVVTGEEGNIPGITSLVEELRSHITIAKCLTPSDMGCPSQRQHAQRVANAHLLAFCYNNFEKVLKELEKLRKENKASKGNKRERNPMPKRLSKAQQRFLDSIYPQNQEDKMAFRECQAQEAKTALALERHGIVEFGKRPQKETKRFTARMTENARKDYKPNQEE
jgi:hypothetical protein